MLFNLESGIHAVDHKVYKVNHVNAIHNVESDLSPF